MTLSLTLKERLSVYLKINDARDYTTRATRRALPYQLNTTNQLNRAEPTGEAQQRRAKRGVTNIYQYTTKGA